MSIRRNPIILVDTNVWLDLYLPARPGSVDARAFFAQARRADTTLVYPAASLRDVMYIIEADLKRERRAECGGTLVEADASAIKQIAWACADNLRELGTAVGMDESDLWLACKYRSFNADIEDNIVLAAAKRANADYLVTSDKELLRKAVVPALCPSDMAALLATDAPAARDGQETVQK